MTNSSFMQFNKADAERAGNTRMESGEHIGTLAGEHITASTGTMGISLSLHGEVEINYIDLYYKKKDGTQLKGANNFLQAIMGILRINDMNIDTVERSGGGQLHQVREFEQMQPKIGLVLRKVLKTKQNGDDSYGFDLVMPFCAKTRKTCKEIINNEPATAVDKILDTLTDRDDRKKMAPDPATAYGAPVTKFQQAEQQSKQGGFQQNQSPQGSDLSMDDNEFFNS